MPFHGGEFVMAGKEGAGRLPVAQKVPAVKTRQDIDSAAKCRYLIIKEFLRAKTQQIFRAVISSARGF